MKWEYHDGRQACCGLFVVTELRYNPNNNGVAYQCVHCGSPRSNWIKHSELTDLNVAALPRWADRTIPGQASLPF